MQIEKEPLQIRLPKGSGQKLKILAARRGTSISYLAQEALGLWWAQQPEAKTEGALFASEASPKAPTPENQTKTTR